MQNEQRHVTLMKYLVVEGYTRPTIDSALPMVGVDISAILASLRGRRRVLYLFKDSEHWLELAFRENRVLVSEQFGKKRMHLRKAMAADEAQGLALRYTREFVTDTIAWYPSLLEWEGLRFGSPRLFSLLNERYRIQSAVGASIVMGIGVLLGLGAMWLTSTDGTIRLKAPFVGIGLYAVLLAKRVEFVDRREKRYGYGG